MKFEFNYSCVFKMFGLVLAAIIGIQNSFSQSASLSDLSKKDVSSLLVRVYHHTDDDKAVESIKKHGLLNLKELFSRGLTERNSSKLGGLFNDHFDVIYFQWLLDAPLRKEAYVGFDVDPNTTYVYNREYRVDVNSKKYQASKITLAHYIMQQKKATELRKNAKPGEVVIFNPCTAEPFYVSRSDKRYHNPDRFKRMTFDGNQPDREKHYLYLNEIIVPTACIPPSQLIFAEQDLLRNDNGSSAQREKGELNKCVDEMEKGLDVVIKKFREARNKNNIQLGESSSVKMAMQNDSFDKILGFDAVL